MKFPIMLMAVVAFSMCGGAFAGDKSSAEMMKKVDTDGDGKISMAEHDAHSKMMFSMMDTDKDGSVTAAEMEAGHKMMMDGKKMDGDKMDDGMKKDPATN